MQYFIFKHYSKNNPHKKLEEAKNNKCCLCQYEYRNKNEKEFQNKSTVTKIWKIMKEVKENDIIILCSKGNTLKYAWGHAIKPRFSNRELKIIEQNCVKMIKTRHDNYKYRSAKCNEYIKFKDCECFYENLEKERGWGQRIDVDYWHDYNEVPIKYKHSYKSSPDATIQKISEEDALKIILKLKDKKNFNF